MITRLSGLTRTNRLSPVYPISPLQSFREEMEWAGSRERREPEAARAPVTTAYVSSEVKRAAAAASSVVQKAIDVRYAVDQVYLSPTYDSMSDLQSKAERFSEQIHDEHDLQLDPTLTQRLSAAYSPTGWREIADPFLEQPPQRMLPLREAIYNGTMQLHSLNPDKGLLLATEA